MIPGEILVEGDHIIGNAARFSLEIEVVNQGDRPIQVGSHYHFAEVNPALNFDREAAYGMRLDIVSGTAVRFEPGFPKVVQLVDLGGTREVYGLRGLVNGPLDSASDEESK